MHKIPPAASESNMRFCVFVTLETSRHFPYTRHDKNNRSLSWVLLWLQTSPGLSKQLPPLRAGNRQDNLEGTIERRGVAIAGVLQLRDWWVGSSLINAANRLGACLVFASWSLMDGLLSSQVPDQPWFTNQLCDGKKGFRLKSERDDEDNTEVYIRQRSPQRSRQCMNTFLKARSSLLFKQMLNNGCNHWRNHNGFLLKEWRVYRVLFHWRYSSTGEKTAAMYFHTTTLHLVPEQRL